MNLLRPLLLFSILGACGTTLEVNLQSERPSETEFLIADAMYYLNSYEDVHDEELQNRVKELFLTIDFYKATEADRIKHIKTVDKKVRSFFTYKDDSPDDLSSWQQGLRSLITDNNFEGDCEDLTLTTAEILKITGIPDSHLYKIITKSGNTELDINHMIGGYQSHHGGKLWIFGDTFSNKVEVLREPNRTHKVVKYSRFDWGSDYAFHNIVTTD